MGKNLDLLPKMLPLPLPESPPAPPPLHPSRSPERLQRVLERLQDGEWTRLEGAPETEADLQAYHGGGEVWYVSSGTAALRAILLGHGVGPGDEVITPAYTWGATVAAILMIGAVPVFADLHPQAPVLDPASVEASITPRTKAILAVHLFGTPCDMTALMEIARRHNLLLFEDGSQAHGARLKGQRVGRLGHASAFSCMALKPLGGTEGGYAVFEDRQAAERAYLHGKHPRGLPSEQAAALSEAGLLDSLQLGWRPCAIGAELVRMGLPELDRENEGRRANARMLREFLEDVPGLSLDPEPPGTEPIYHLVSIRLDPDQIHLDPSTCVERLQPLGLNAFHYIPTPLHQLTRINWKSYQGPPVFWHQQLRKADTDYANVSLPETEIRCRTSFELSWNWTEPNEAAIKDLAVRLATLASPSR